MTKEVDFYFDFASPNAYLSHQVVKKIEESTGANFNYIPVLLGGIFKTTNNKPPMEQFFGVLNKIKSSPRTLSSFGCPFISEDIAIGCQYLLKNSPHEVPGPISEIILSNSKSSD